MNRDQRYSFFEAVDRLVRILDLEGYRHVWDADGITFDMSEANVNPTTRAIERAVNTLAPVYLRQNRLEAKEDEAVRKRERSK